MKTLKDNLIILHECPDVSRSLLRKVLKTKHLLASIYKISTAEFADAVQIPYSKSTKIYHFMTNTNIMKKLDKNRKKYHYITWFDKEYPTSLRTIPDPPLVLYASGNPSLLLHPLNISIVGTRTPSNYAFPAMNKILPPLVKAGFSIVSGMAMGIDQYAHQIALANQGKTIAVIGSGFNHLYPKNNLNLFEHLTKHQIVVSEYPRTPLRESITFQRETALYQGFQKLLWWSKPV